MSNVLIQAIEWIQTRPYWERLAFKGVLEGKEFTEEDYDELIGFCLEDAGIEEKKSERPEILWTDIDTSE